MQGDGTVVNLDSAYFLAQLKYTLAITLRRQAAVKVRDNVAYHTAMYSKKDMEPFYDEVIIADNKVKVVHAAPPEGPHYEEPLY